MTRKIAMFFATLCAVNFLWAQNANETLFTVAGQNVSVGEFTRVYTRNNIDNQADFSQKSLEEYLDLYKNFKLKVAEAEALGMDTGAIFQRELASYRGQLVPTYLSDRKATDALIKEAYQRMQEEVKVSHILIFYPNHKPTSADSLKIVKELKQIKQTAEKMKAPLKDAFAQQMKRYNNQSAQRYKDKAKYESGTLDYFTVFQTVYPFENAMYNTPVGKISEPIATRFGYHLVLVEDKRPARGKMETAHLFIKSKADDSQENQQKAKETAQKIYQDIKSGAITFDSAVREYSEDKRSKYQGGKLPLLSSGQMLAPYAEAVFALEKDDEITAPVKTRIGWHIIKRIKKEQILPFEKMKMQLEQNVNKDSRANVARQQMLNDTKKEFGFKANAMAYEQIEKALVQNYKDGKFNIRPIAHNENLFSIGNKNYTQQDFLRFINTIRVNNKKVEPVMLIENYYQQFEQRKIREYRENNLEEIEPEFKILMQEYHDGILLFELTNEEVWSKASKDTTGLQQFFEANRDKYTWKERIAYDQYTCQDQATADKLKRFLNKGKNATFALKKLNKKAEKINYVHFVQEKDDEHLDKNLQWQKDFILEEKNLDGSVLLYNVVDVLAPSHKEMKETRGYVISDYQTVLEERWLSRLAKKYPIKVNTSVFNSLIKK